MSTMPAYLRNWERVVNAFGYWPSFHDARLHGFHYATEGIGSIQFVVHGWELTSEVDERGYFRTTKHHLVRFRFDVISAAALGDFAPENVLFELGFSSAPEPDGGFMVTLDSAMGSDLGGQFRARFGEVLEVTPCDAIRHV